MTQISIRRKAAHQNPHVKRASLSPFLVRVKRSMQLNITIAQHPMSTDWPGLPLFVDSCSNNLYGLVPEFPGAAAPWFLP